MTLSAPHSPIPLAEALSLWLDGVALTAIERVAPEEAVGRVLAEALHGQADFPQTHIALRAGYAVESAATIGASAYSPVIMMETPRAVAIGEPLPPGADAVLPEDALSFEGPIAEVLAEASPGENVRRAGENLRAGDLLRAAGEVFREADRMIAERIGIAACEVRIPWVRIVGDAGVIAAAVARCGGMVAADDDADAVIVVGEAEFVPLAARLALRPGEEVALGRDGAGRPVIRVPNLPDCLMAAALVLVPPLLRRLSGAVRDMASASHLKLTRRISSNVGLAEIVLLACEKHEATPIAIGDLPLSAIARADAWALVPPEAEGHAAGDAISANALW